MITGLHETHPDDEFGPHMSWLTGVEAESNVEIAGNTVVGGWMGVRCGGYRQNIRVEGNRLVDNDYGVTFQIGEGVGPRGHRAQRNPRGEEGGHRRDCGPGHPSGRRRRGRTPPPNIRGSRWRRARPR